MPPRGGARHSTRIVAVSETNHDIINTYDSLSAAAKGLNVACHSTVSRALNKGRPLNGFKLSIFAGEQAPDTPNEADDGHNEFTFFDEVDNMFKGQKVRYTKDQPSTASVFDVIKVVTGTKNPHTIYARLQLQYPEVLTFADHQFSGSGERPTPVCTVEQVIELINILPGPRAARFRQAGAKVLVRVLGGDETLISEIRANATKIASAHPDNPMNMFQLPEGMSGVNAVCSVLLSPSMEGKSVADFRGPCTYLIVFKHDEKVAMKFGWTKTLGNRMKDHYKVYPDMKVWIAIECDSSEIAEETEKLFKGKMSGYLHTIQLENKDGSCKNSTEILLNAPLEKAEEQMRAAHEIVIKELASREDRSLDLEKIKLEREKIQMEKLRMLLELKRLGVDVPSAMLTIG